MLIRFLRPLRRLREPPTPRARHLLLALAALSLLWAAASALTGGIVFQAPWGRVSSRGAIRPLAVAALAGIAYVYWFHEWWAVDTLRVPWVRRPRVLAAIVSSLAFVIGVALGTFSAGGSDPSGYVSQAQLWLRGDLIVDAPAWVANAPWPDAERTATPLGYIAGRQPLTQIPSYAPGLPIVMAVFQFAGGADAVYFVVPLLGAILVWSTFLIAGSLAGPWAGLIAAVLMLTSPVFLVWLVMPMTDVPVAAYWAVATVLALRATAKASVLSGLAASLAILTRPNLAPLVVPIAALIVIRSGAWRNVLPFAAGILPSVLAVAAINAYLYGSPLVSGYGPVTEYYRLDRVVPNLQRYLSWLASSQTPVLVLALLAPFVVKGRTRYSIGLIAVALPLATLAMYLPWVVFDDWVYLRFLLPAYPGLFAGTAVMIVLLVRAYRATPAVIAASALIVSGLALHGLAYSNMPADLAASEPRYRTAAEYAERLPANAVFLSLAHSGSLRHYTGRSIFRWDLLDPPFIDAAMDHLARAGHPLYLVADSEEMPLFAERFGGSRTGRQVLAATPVQLGTVVIYPVPRP